MAKYSNDPFKHPMVGTVVVKGKGKDKMTFTCAAYTDEGSNWCCKETNLCYTNTNKVWRLWGILS